jgi:hypothetical protein
MESDQFDVLTRQCGADGSSRRRLLRALAVGLGGSALGSGVFGLGLAEVVARMQRSARHSGRQGQVEDERKHRKKKRHKDNAQSPQEPQECADGERRCPDGSCVSQGSCCGDQRACGDGSCIAPNQCCPNADSPTCAECEVATCEDGELVCRSTCGGGICCNGHCAGPCSGGMEINPATCQCECPSGTELLADGVTCCPSQRACGFKSNDARIPTVCCAELDHCCHDFDICVHEGSACS